MEVPSNPNGPRLVPPVPQIDPKYLSMAAAEAYSAYNAKAMFEDTEISKNLEDMRGKTQLEGVVHMFDRMHKLEREAQGRTPGELDDQGMPVQSTTLQDQYGDTTTRIYPRSTGATPPNILPTRTPVQR